MLIDNCFTIFGKYYRDVVFVLEISKRENLKQCNSENLNSEFKVEDFSK